MPFLLHESSSCTAAASPSPSPCSSLRLRPPPPSSRPSSSSSPAPSLPISSPNPPPYPSAPSSSPPSPPAGSPPMAPSNSPSTPSIPALPSPSASSITPSPCRRSPGLRGATCSSTSNRGVTGARLQDDGNFVLFNGSGDVLWQSFDSPTDTLLPGQKLMAGQSLRAVADSPYTAAMQSTGNLSLMWEGNTTYWGSNTSSLPVLPAYLLLNASQPGPLALCDKQGRQLKQWQSNDYTDSSVILRRLTMDGDGNLRTYSWSSGSSEWSVGWQAVQDQCRVYGYCGDNGLCSYNGSGPTCICVGQAGYVAIDSANPRSGCKPPASGGAQNCTMVTANNSLLYIVDKVDSTPYNAGAADCSSTCLKNGLCIAASFSNDGSGICYLKLGYPFSGYQELSMPSLSFFKLCGTAPALTTSPSPYSSPSSKPSLIVPIVASILGTLGVLVVGQAALWYCCCRKNPRFGGYSAQYALLEYASGAPVQFTYRELQSATHSFQEKLGEGGFGAVYKGSLPNKMEVAVKRLEGADQGEKQFRMEVSIIGSTHHMNLVRVCGFCAEGKHRLLVYEFLRNGSLDRYLFEETSSDLPNLEWETRYNVLLGTARGITYLHQECRDCIIHCDIKPENILLDENFCAKVSDFGLAKLTIAKDRARNLTTVRGTRGYLAPEWRSNLPITAKSDVFSFGMVVLETVSGRKSFDTSMTSSTRQSFSEWAYGEYFEQGRAEGVVDGRVRSKASREEVDRALKVAFWCMQVQPSLRPSMSRVIQMLEGTLPVDDPPKPRSFGGGGGGATAAAEHEQGGPEDAAIFRSISAAAAARRSNLTTTSLVANPVHTFSISEDAPPPHRSF